MRISDWSSDVCSSDLVYEAGLSPLVLETGASALIAPLLTGEALPRPVAVARLADLPRGVRFLAEARTLLVDLGDDVAVVDMAATAVAPLDGPYAYPLGQFAAVPDLAAARRTEIGREACRESGCPYV